MLCAYIIICYGIILCFCTVVSQLSHTKLQLAQPLWLADSVTDKLCHFAEINFWGPTQTQPKDLVIFAMEMRWTLNKSSLWAPAQFKRRSVSLGDHGCCCFSVGWEWCGSPQLGVTIPCCVAVWKRSKTHLISQREQFRPWLVELILVLTGTKSLEPAPGNVSTNWCLDTEKSFSSVD